jgi:uncharacterized small protein (DUF1192 family)
MQTKKVEYYDHRIEALKAQIRRLWAERRIAVLKEKEQRALVCSKAAEKGSGDVSE